MKTWVRKSLNVGVLSAGFLLVSGGAAHADWTTGYNAGLLDGNQLDSKLQVPIDVSGNALGLLGFADAQSGGGAVANTESASTESANSTESWTTGFNGGILNGNQLSNTIQAPINVCGNSIAVLGFANASCGGGAVANTGGMHAHRGGESSTLERRHHNGGGMAAANGWGGAGANSNGGGNWTTGYNAGLLNGNQASNTIQVPIDLCGNSVAVLGFANASCSGGSWANAESASTESARTEDWTTGFNAGVANGNQVSNTIQVPIDICGNSVAVLGFASASCGGGAVANTGGMGNGTGNGGRHHHHDGDGNDGNGAGNGGGDYGNGSNSGAYDAAGQSAGATGVKSHKAKSTNKAAKTVATSAVGQAADEHGTWGDNSDPMGDADANGYGAAASNGYSDSNGGDDAYGGTGNSNGDDGYGGTGSGNGGYDGNGNGTGDDNGGRHHHGGWGNGSGDDNGMGNGGGARANAGSCGDWTTGYNAGLLNGNQLSNTVQLPINISGNAIGVLGFANASSQGGAVANAC